MARTLQYSLKSLVFAVAIVCGLLWILLEFVQLRQAHDLTLYYYGGDVATVKKYLADGVSPSSRDRWDGTPLVYASTRGHVEIVEALLQAGADVNERS